jgi:hypothetical protein
LNHYKHGNEHAVAEHLAPTLPRGSDAESQSVGRISAAPSDNVALTLITADDPRLNILAAEQAKALQQALAKAALIADITDTPVAALGSGMTSKTCPQAGSCVNTAPTIPSRAARSNG